MVCVDLVFVNVGNKRNKQLSFLQNKDS